MNSSGGSKQRTIVAILIFLGMILMIFFGWRTFHAFGQFRGHRPPRPPFEQGKPVTDVELIRDWMTIPMIGKMYHVPPPVIFSALNISQNGNDKRNLRELNAKYFPDDSGHVLEVVKATVQANLPPTPLPANTVIAPATMAPPATALSPVSP